MEISGMMQGARLASFQESLSLDPPRSLADLFAKQGGSAVINKIPDAIRSGTTIQNSFTKKAVYKPQPVEKLEVIRLCESKLEKEAHVGSQLPEKLKHEIVVCLKENMDIFAWAPADMPGINPKVICHHLNVDPHFKPMHQKKQNITPDKLVALKEEVDKLLEAGFIREVLYPDWLANVVMVKKSNDECTMEAYVDDMIVKILEQESHVKKLSQAGKKFEWTEQCQKSFEALKEYLKEVPLLTRPKIGETLYVYLGISERAISAVLIKKEGQSDRPIYYVSKVLQGPETRYPFAEKVVLALVNAARKLRPYFQAYSIIVWTDQPLRSVLQKPECSG
ncbi:uncharacterized protein LOC127794788 [Diospyros lotus]|uniref:uncharacterized protein LOC127794788 n=1 Tax=Diospyros lotus TaxID=55363 RepID=UPI002251BCFD|nr:uncharacterized protein LOC127794788 [Diospyros lotus]